MSQNKKNSQNIKSVCYGLWGVFFLLLLISTGFLPKALTNYFERQYPIVKTVDSHMRWVVVFGGGQAELPNIPPNILLGTVSISRLVEGVRLYRQLPHAKILLSGGGGDPFTVSEAQRLSELLVWFKIPAVDVVLEATSRNTAEEAEAIKTIVHDEPFYLVTSAIHMPRAMALCRAQGLHPIAAPTDFTFRWEGGSAVSYLPKPYNLFAFTIALHELLGRGVAKLTEFFYLPT